MQNLVADIVLIAIVVLAAACAWITISLPALRYRIEEESDR